ncbi:hypothetical protein [Desulfovibrio fairfieldensis]|uniref:Uncharacterized protein n=1 Tax=Desulfovibrio fairfieldensis TaxID=44742 RepID=A0A109W491_9BACT|nr:hypothetical protein [Desulfovibrio fairfieldensis]AMD90020.1 hypothetical protein AXF13_07760 [Desulfovibrio fairfieldensis]
MTADELLADLEAKAQEAEQGEWKAITKEFFGDVSSEVEVKSSGTVAYDLNPDDAAFIAAANPATVLRLVAMVRWLAGQGDYVCPPEKFRTVDCPEVQREEFCPCKRCWAEAAYNATEASHD